MSLAGAPQRVNLIQMAVLNLSMRHLAGWLVTQDIEEIRGWARSGQSMVAMIPQEFEIDRKALSLDGRFGQWIEQRSLIPSLRTMGPVHWDQFLHLMDDMAQGVIDGNHGRDEQQVESGLYLQEIVGAFLDPSQNHGSVWYYDQMDELRNMMVRKLEATS